MRVMLKVVFFVLNFLLLLPQKALAYTECSGHVTQIYVTDGGALYVWFDNGVWTNMASNDPNFNGSLALMTTALTTGKMALYRTSQTSCGNQGGAAVMLTGTSILNHS